HMALIRSPLVVSEAVKMLDPAKSPWLATTGDPVAAAISRLKVQRPDRLTKIITVEYQASSPPEALRMIEAGVATYKKLLETNYQRTNQEVITLIRKASNELKKELDDLQDAYYKFRKDHPGLAVGENGHSLMMSRLEQWNKGINNSSEAIIKLQTELDLIK